MVDYTIEKPWEKLKEIIEAGHRSELQVFLQGLDHGEMARAISRLAPEEQRKLLLLLGPSVAADVIEDVPDEQAANMIENLSPGQAAEILDEVLSDQKADLLGQLESEDAEAILQQMTPG